MTPDRFREILAGLDLSQARIRQAFGLGANTANRWANGTPIPGPAAILLEAMAAGLLEIGQVEDLAAGRRVVPPADALKALQSQLAAILAADPKAA
jgi:hypothetical protein